MAPRRGIRLDIRYVRSVVMIEIRPVSLPDGSDQFSRQILSKFQTYLGSLGKCARRAPQKWIAFNNSETLSYQILRLYDQCQEL